MSLTERSLLLVQQAALEQHRALLAFARAVSPVITTEDSRFFRLSIGGINPCFFKDKDTGNIKLYVHGNIQATRLGHAILKITPRLVRLESYFDFRIDIVETGEFIAEMTVTTSLIPQGQRTCFPIMYKAKVEEFFKEICKAFNWEIRQS